MISIHAPRGGSDQDGDVLSSLDFLISIHAPRGGSDCTAMIPRAAAVAFQSTLPVGGATAFLPSGLPVTRISIHAPRGGSDAQIIISIKNDCISIHAPRGGSDLYCSSVQLYFFLFQSTLPVGGATLACFS